MIIYTHYNLDLDAASTAGLAHLLNRERGIPTIAYISADTTLAELKKRSDFEEDFLVLDIDCDGVGIKGDVTVTAKRTYVNSAFSLYLSMQQNELLKDTFKDLAVYIDKLDSGIQILDDNSNSVQTMFIALKRSFELYENPDKALMEVWLKIIEGIYLNRASYVLACEEAKTAKWPYKNIAIIKNTKQPQVSSILRGKGAEFVIYENGNNMGVVIDLNTVPKVISEALGRELPGWFVHPSGFLVSWGTRKALKETSPNITSKEVSSLINEIYN